VFGTLNGQQIADLPSANRNVMNLAVNAPADAEALFFGFRQDSNLVKSGTGSAFLPQQQPQGVAVGGVAAPGAFQAPAVEIHLAIAYRVLRQTPAGDFVDVAADGTVAAGTTVKLQITPNDNGYLRVTERRPDDIWREVLVQQVERMKPIETQPMLISEAGQKQFQVWLSRQPFQALAQITAEATAGKDIAKQTVSTASAGVGGGRGGRGGAGGSVNYAANRDASTQQVSVTIALTVH
jgi:hypothetical protein